MSDNGQVTSMVGKHNHVVTDSQEGGVGGQRSRRGAEKSAQSATEASDGHADSAVMHVRLFLMSGDL